MVGVLCSSLFLTPTPGVGNDTITGPGGSLASTLELSRERVRGRVLTQVPVVCQLPVLSASGLRRRGIIMRGKGILTVPTLGETETLSEGLLLPFLTLPRSLVSRMGIGRYESSQPPGGASEAGSLRGHRLLHTEVLLFITEVCLPTGISRWFIFLSRSQPAWLKCFAIFQKAHITPVAHALHCNTSKIILKAKFTTEEASAWAS